MFLLHLPNDTLVCIISYIDWSKEIDELKVPLTCKQLYKISIPFLKKERRKRTNLIKEERENCIEEIESCLERYNRGVNPRNDNKNSTIYITSILNSGFVKGQLFHIAIIAMILVFRVACVTNAFRALFWKKIFRPNLLADIGAMDEKEYEIFIKLKADIISTYNDFFQNAFKRKCRYGTIIFFLAWKKCNFLMKDLMYSPLWNDNNIVLQIGTNLDMMYYYFFNVEFSNSVNAFHILLEAMIRIHNEEKKPLENLSKLLSEEHPWLLGIDSNNDCVLLIKIVYKHIRSIFSLNYTVFNRFKHIFKTFKKILNIKKEKHIVKISFNRQVILSEYFYFLR